MLFYLREGLQLLPFNRIKSYCKHHNNVSKLSYPKSLDQIRWLFSSLLGPRSLHCLHHRQQRNQTKVVFLFPSKNQMCQNSRSRTISTIINKQTHTHKGEKKSGCPNISVHTQERKKKTSQHKCHTIHIPHFPTCSATVINVAWG